jgi:two-component sensor histidine kinase
VVGDSAPSVAPRSSEASAILAQQTVIQEMDHRIKNHLQLLASYARMASRRRGLTAGELAEDLADKLFAIAGAHEALHRAHGRGFGLARPFLQTLVAAFAGSPQRIHIDCDAGLQLPAAELAPVGMIVSEAIANALKHAFPAGQDGQIWVGLVHQDGRVSLTIRDDGVGMRDLPDERISGRGLIETLARQLGGHARLGDAPFGGASVSIVYPRRS